jgi:hypothetical protein
MQGLLFYRLIFLFVAESILLAYAISNRVRDGLDCFF